MAELIPPGTYNDCTIEDHYLERVGGKQTPCLTYFVKVPNYEKNVRGQLWMSEKAVERSIDTLIEVFDFAGTMQMLGPQSAGGGALIGKECQVTIEHETFTGKTGDNVTVARVKWLNKNNSERNFGPSEDELADVASSLQNSMNSLLAAKLKQLGKEQVQGTDDVPF